MLRSHRAAGQSSGGSSDELRPALYSHRPVPIASETKLLCLRERGLLFDVLCRQFLAGRGQCCRGPDVVPLAIVHDRVQTPRPFGTVE